MIEELGLLAFAVEAVTEYAFDWTGKWGIKQYVAIAVGVVLGCAFQANVFPYIFSTADSTAVGKWVGIVFTGVILGRGSNFIHDLKTRAIPSLSERKYIAQ